MCFEIYIGFIFMSPFPLIHYDNIHSWFFLSCFPLWTGWQEFCLLCTFQRICFGFVDRSIVCLLCSLISGFILIFFFLPFFWCSFYYPFSHFLHWTLCSLTYHPSFPSVNHQTNSISSSSIWLPHSSFHKECFHCCTILMVIIYVIIFPLTYGLFISWLLAWNIWNNN